MMLPADGKSVVITRPSVIVETFFQETLRSFDIAEPMVESSGTENIRLTGEIHTEDVSTYMKDSLSSGPNSFSL
jgi:hypothetical protein